MRSPRTVAVAVVTTLACAASLAAEVRAAESCGTARSLIIDFREIQAVKFCGPARATATMDGVRTQASGGSCWVEGSTLQVRVGLAIGARRIATDPANVQLTVPAAGPAQTAPAIGRLEARGIIINFRPTVKINALMSGGTYTGLAKVTTGGVTTNQPIIGTFACGQELAIRLRVVVDGIGRVSAAGLSCSGAAGRDTGTCAAPFLRGRVPLRATPVRGWKFGRWVGAGRCTTSPICTLRTNAAGRVQEVRAVFIEDPDITPPS